MSNINELNATGFVTDMNSMTTSWSSMWCKVFTHSRKLLKLWKLLRPSNFIWNYILLFCNVFKLEYFYFIFSMSHHHHHQHHHLSIFIYPILSIDHDHFIDKWSENFNHFFVVVHIDFIGWTRRISHGRYFVVGSG